jgi:large subunit ribosomal protein L24
MAQRIKTGDTVMVIAGANKGSTGRVLRILAGDAKGAEKVIVEGVNRVWKHVRPTQQNNKGGRIQKDAPIHISNVMPVDPATGKPTRVKFADIDGKKHRVAVRGGADLGVVGR